MQARFVSAALALPAALAIVTPALQAQDTYGKWWDNHQATNGAVYAIAVQGDDNVVIGGEFTAVISGVAVTSTVTRNHIARVKADGTLDEVFDPNVNGAVWAVAQQEDGMLLIGGSFTTVGGASRSYIARLWPGGGVDTSFNPTVQGVIKALVIQPDYKILIAGAFGVKRLNPDGSSDTAFNPTTGAVEGIAIQADGKVLVGGSSFLHRLDATTGAVETGFAPTVNGHIYAISLQLDGKILVGGLFSALNGATIYGLGRLNQNGTLDSTFQFNNQYANAGSAVFSLVLDAGGTMLVAGNFGRILRVNSDGTVDTRFDASAPGYVFALALLTDVWIPMPTPLDPILATAIIVGGDFTITEFDLTYFANLMALNNVEAAHHIGFDGANKVSWTRMWSDPELMWMKFEFSTDGSSWTQVGPVTHSGTDWILTLSQPHVDGWFRALGYYGSGKGNGSGSLYISPAVRVNTIYDTSTTLTSNKGPTVLTGELVTFTATVSAGKTDIPTGTITFFNNGAVINGCLARAMTNGAATCLSNFDSGSRSITAQYSGSVEFHASTSPAYPLTVLLRETATSVTSSVPTYVLAGNGVTFTATVTTPGDVPSGTVTFLDGGTTLGSASVNASGVANLTTSALVTSGKHVIMAQFVANSVFSGSSAMLNQYVQVTPPAPDYYYFGPFTTGIVYSIAVQPDGNILVGGFFTSIGQEPHNYIARLQINGSTDAAFTGGADAIVQALSVQPDGKILVGGGFTQLSGQPRNYIGRLNSNGVADAFNPGANGQVLAIALQPDGKILVGGSFTTLAGQSVSQIGRLDADGNLDTGFSPSLPAGTNCSVSAIAVQPDGKILIARPCADEVRSVMRLNPNGSTDWSISNYPNAYSFALQSDGKILVGASGYSALQRLNANGMVDSSFTASAFPSPVYAIALQTDGKVLVGGNFNYLDRKNPDGTTDFTMPIEQAAGAAGNVRALAIQPDGKVLLGGQFLFSRSSLIQQNIGRLLNSIAATQQLQFNGNTGQLTWTRGGSSPELTWTEFQFSTDAQNWTTAAAGARTAGGWTGTVSRPHVTGTFRALGFYGTGQYSGSGSLASSLLPVDNAYDVSVAVSASAQNAQVGQPVTLTAAVTPAGSGSGTPTGTVEFLADGLTIGGCDAQPLAAGQATCVTSFNWPGTPGITAKYSGDVGFHKNDVSNAVQVTVTSPAVTTAISVGAPSISYGADATVTVNVMAAGGSAAPTGSVSLTVDGGGALVQSLTVGPGLTSTANLTIVKPPAGSRTVSATYSPTGNFTPSGPVTTLLIVNPAKPAITFGEAPAPAYLGGNFTVSASTTNTDSPTLTYTAVSGPCTSAGGAVFSSTGAGICVVQAGGLATANFEAAFAQQSVTIGKASVTISISNLPATATYGGNFTPAFAYTGDGTPSVTSSNPSYCTVAAGTVRFAGAGTCILTAHASAGVNYAVAEGVAQSFAIGQATATLTFAPSPTPAYLGGPFTVSASTNNTDSSALTYSRVSGPCVQVGGGTFDSSGAGECVIQAIGAATANFLAGSAQQTVVIGKAAGTISISNLPASAVYGGSFQPAFAYTGDGSPSVTSGSPSYCTVSAGIVNFVGAGTCALTAHATAGTNYAAADGIAQSFTIGQISASVTFGAAPTPTYLGADFAVSAITTNTDSNALTYSAVSGPCASSGGAMFHATGAGSCVVRASGAATANFRAASAEQTVVVGRASTTISIGNLPSTALYGGSFTAVFAYAGDGTPSVNSTTPSSCTVSAAVVSFVGAGTCALTAHATAGVNYLAVDGAAQSFTIGPAMATVKFAPAPTPTYLGAPFTVSASTTNIDSSTLTYSHVSGPCVQVSGGTFNSSGAGNCVVQASGVATSNFQAASGQQTVIIAKASVPISINNLPVDAVYNGSFTPAFAYTGDGAPSVSSTTTSYCAVSGGVVHFVAAGVCTLTAHAAAGVNYVAVDGAAQSFAIGKAPAAIGIGNIPSAAVYGGSFTPAYSYTGDGTPSVTSTTTAYCTVSGGVVSFVGAGTCAVTAHATEGANYLAANGNAQSFAIGQATAAVTFATAPTATYLGSPFTVNATTTNTDSSALTYTRVSGPCAQVSGPTFSATGAGSCVVQAGGAATANFQAASAQQTVIIAKASVPISVNNLPASSVFNGSFTPTFAYTGDGTPSVTSSTTNSCAVSSGVVHFVGAGLCTLTAHATAGANYAAVDGAAQSFAIGKASATIGIGNLPTTAMYGGSFTPAYSYTGDGSPSVTSGTTSYCTVSGGVVNFVGAGNCTLTAHATEGANYLAANGSPQTFTVVRRGIAIVPNTGQGKVYGNPDPILTFTVGGSGLAAGDTIAGVFTGGLARAPGDNVGSYAVTQGTLAANLNYSITSFTTGVLFTITPLLAGNTVAYTGLEDWATASTSATSVPVTSSATVSVNAGDITTATVRFTATPTTGGSVQTCTGKVGRISGSAGGAQTGSASCTWTGSTGTTAAGQTYTIVATLGANYGGSSDDDVVNVHQPAASNTINGSGAIVAINEAGPYAGAPNSKTNFGLNVKYNKSGANLQGNMNILVRRGDTVYQFKSTALTQSTANLTPAPASATLVSKGNGQTWQTSNPTVVTSLGGNLTIQLQLHDVAEPGAGSDTVAITIWDGNGAVVFASNWNGSTTVEQVIARGNVQIR